METLDDVVRRLREYAGAQVSGRTLSRTEILRQRQLVQQLLDRHLRPIVAIARATDDDESGQRFPATIRLPRRNLGVTKILQACDGIIDAARPFEAAFVSRGLPADFLARLTTARNEIAQLMGGRAALVGTHVAARTGLQVQMRRGRSVVTRVDAVVRASFDGDEVTLAAWRAAKRVHQQPGGSGEQEVVEEEAVESIAHAA